MTMITLMNIRILMMVTIISDYDDRQLEHSVQRMKLMRVRSRILMKLRMSILSYDVGHCIGDDPFLKGPVRYTRRCEKSSSIRSFIQLGQEIQTRQQEGLSPDLKAAWRQMGQPYQRLP